MHIKVEGDFKGIMRKISALCGLILVLILIILLAIYNKKSATTDKTTSSSINKLVISAQNTVSEEIAKEKTQDTEEGGQIILPLLSQENPEDYFEGEIEIPRVLEADEDGLITITEPRSILSTKTDNPEELVDSRKQDFEAFGVEIVDAYANKDSSATFVYTDTNVEKYISSIENVFNKRIGSLNNDVSVNKDFNKLYIYVDENSRGGEFGYDLYLMQWHMIVCQIYYGIPHNEWQIDVYVVNKNVGDIILEYNFTEEDHGFKMTSEEWEQLFE